MKLIDNLAWIELKDKSILLALRWFTYSDKDQVEPVDQLIFDHLKHNNLLD